MPGRSPREVKPRTTRARDLRKRSQDAEGKLWQERRNRKLAGFKFRRQHPIDRFIVDFACVEAKIVVELDGAHHHQPGQAAFDAGRTEIIKSCGWLLLRFDNDHFDDEFAFDHALGDIRRALETSRA